MTLKKWKVSFFGMWKTQENVFSNNGSRVNKLHEQSRQFQQTVYCAILNSRVCVGEILRRNSDLAPYTDRAG